MRTRKVIAGLLATAMVLTGLSIAPKKAEAATASGVVYELVDEILVGEAPVFDGVTEGFVTADEAYDYANSGEGTFTTVDAKAGYLFGGWYFLGEDEGGNYMLCPEADGSGSYVANGVEYIDAYGAYFAKWVPASVLSVKAQNTANTTKDSKSTNTRVISAVDSLDYAEVGFEILLNNKTSLGELTTTKVYEKLEANGAEVYPQDYFGGLDEEQDAYFIVWRLTGIDAVNFGKIIYVRPYWVTADGVKVEGLAKYVHVEDDYNKYISIPVNLNVLSEDEVAAGVFEISYPEGLTLVEDKVEMGRVFGELEFADKGSSVKFAANVEDISKNAKANDIYVNLRFTVDGGGAPAHTEYNFAIQGTPDFCDNEENKVEVDIWDVLY